MQYREDHVISRKLRHIAKTLQYHADHVISRILRFLAELVCCNISPVPREKERRAIADKKVKSRDNLLTVRTPRLLKDRKQTAFVRPATVAALRSQARQQNDRHAVRISTKCRDHEIRLWVIEENSKYR